MENTNSKIIAIINKLKRYSAIGYMDSFEINEIIEELKQAYNQDNLYRLNKMMDDVTEYMSVLANNNYDFIEYVKNNIAEVAGILNRSPRTVYRKIQNNSFTLIEKQMIKRVLSNAEDG